MFFQRFFQELPSSLLLDTPEAKERYLWFDTNLMLMELLQAAKSEISGRFSHKKSDSPAVSVGSSIHISSAIESADKRFTVGKTTPNMTYYFKSKPLKSTASEEMIFSTEVVFQFESSYLHILANLENKIADFSLEVTPEERSQLPPWIDDDGNISKETLTIFLIPVISYLAEYPGASIQKISTALAVLPIDIIEALLRILEDFDIIKPRIPSSTVSIYDPFETNSFWDVSSSISPPASAEVYYELVI
jgi:hypothetical protein